MILATMLFLLCSETGQKANHENRIILQSTGTREKGIGIVLYIFLFFNYRQESLSFVCFALLKHSFPPLEQLIYKKEKEQEISTNLKEFEWSGSYGQMVAFIERE
jgi:hypothetical protein